jgi:8-oxo-dGTP diphosphatase
MDTRLAEHDSQNHTVGVQPRREHALFEISLKILVKNKQGEILILKDPPDGMLYGNWDLPGGRIFCEEVEASFSEILDREIKEELGDKVNITVDSTVAAVGRQHWYPDPTTGREEHRIWLFFEGEHQGGPIIISSEHERYQWVRLDEINMEEYFMGAALEGIREYLPLLRAQSDKKATSRTAM